MRILIGLPLDIIGKVNTESKVAEFLYNDEIPFSKILSQKVTITFPNGSAFTIGEQQSGESEIKYQYDTIDAESGKWIHHIGATKSNSGYVDCRPSVIVFGLQVRLSDVETGVRVERTQSSDIAETNEMVRVELFDRFGYDDVIYAYVTKE